MKVYIFAAEFTKNTGQTITWKTDRDGVGLVMMTKKVVKLVGCVAQLAERRSLADELTLSYARPASDG